MGDIETVKIKSGDGDYAVINKSDFDPDKHKLYDKEQKAETATERKVREESEAKRKYEANRGISGGPAQVDTDRNPSGTYSEPTPTDIRYPDKNQTEFENNHGAFVGKSAAQMREDQGLPDAPGGLNPGSNIEIPDDWKDQPAADRKKLAADISGAEVKTASEADKIIQGEVDRRSEATAAAESQG